MLTLLQVFASAAIRLAIPFLPTRHMQTMGSPLHIETPEGSVRQILFQVKQPKARKVSSAIYFSGVLDWSCNSTTAFKSFTPPQNLAHV